MTRDRVGVVIQGPVMSRGRVLRDLNHRNFDCTQNIVSMVEECKRFDFLPVVVTWRSPSSRELKLQVACDVLELDFPRVTGFRRLTSDWNQNSKYKQYFSTLAGINYLDSRGVDYVLKTRTDLWLDLEAFSVFLRSEGLDSEPGRLYCPTINLDKPHMFYDFYTFADTQTLKKMCDTVLLSKELQSNVHFDVFFRWYAAKRSLPRRPGYLTLFYPKFPNFTRSQLRVIREALARDFGVLPESMWTNQIWRGEEFGNQSLKPGVLVFWDTQGQDVLARYDTWPYKVVKGPSIAFPECCSFFISSRFEVVLMNFTRRVKSVVRKLR